MASRAVTPPSSPRRWSGSRARTSRHYASRQAPTRSPPSSRRPTTSWLRPPPTVTCPLHLLLRRRELRRIPIPRTTVHTEGQQQPAYSEGEVCHRRGESSGSHTCGALNATIGLGRGYCSLGTTLKKATPTTSAG